MWFTITNNQQVGPIEERNIAVELAQGYYNVQTMVWREGLSAWIPIGQSELSKYLPRASPPPYIAQQPQTPSVSMRSRVTGGIGLAWGALVLISGLSRGAVTGGGSFFGLLFSAVMIIVGGYYCFNKPSRRYMVLASLVLMGLIGALLPRSGQRQGNNSPAQAQVSVGETFRTDDFEIVVTRADQRFTVGDEFFAQTPSNGAIYVAIQFIYKNISNKSIGAYSQPSLALIAPDGIKFEPDVSASIALATELELDEKALSDLNPGVQLRSASAFEIGADRFNKANWKIAVNADEQVLVQFLPKLVPTPVSTTGVQAPRPPVEVTQPIPPKIVAFQQPIANIESCTASDLRTRVMVWKPSFASDYLLSLPNFEDGEIVYIEFASDSTASCFGQELNSFSFPSQSETFGGTEVSFIGNASIKGNQCLFAGLYANEYVPGMQMGYTFARFKAVPAQTLLSETYCLRPTNESRSTALSTWSKLMATNALCKSDRFAVQFFTNKFLVLGEKYNFSLTPRNSDAQLIGDQPKFSSGESDTFQEEFYKMRNYQIALQVPNQNQLKGRVSFEKFIDSRWVSQGSELNFSCRN